MLRIVSPSLPSQLTRQVARRRGRPLSAASEGTSPSSHSAAEEGEACLLWFKSDLRVKDNPALSRALAAGKRVVPVYVFDPDVASPFQESQADIALLHTVLESLKRELRGLGSDLVVRCGKAEEEIPRLCEDFGADVVVTQREVVAQWAEKMAAVAAAGVSLKMHTYSLHGENTGWQYPTTFEQLQESYDIAPLVERICKLPPLDLPETETVPSAETFFASMVAAWRGVWPDLPLGEEEAEEAAGAGSVDRFQYKSTYCTPGLLSGPEAASFVLSGDHGEVESQLRRYMRAFGKNEKGNGNVGDLEAMARRWEVPGGFGQSFNVLFRKHLSLGVVSPGMLYRMAEECKAEMQADPWTSFVKGVVEGATVGANACSAAALQHDFANNMMQYSLASDSLLRSGTAAVHKSWLWRGTHQTFIEALPSSPPSSSSSSSKEAEGGEEKVVLFCHGFGAMGAHFRDNIDELCSKGYKVYCPTLPGYGRSEKASAQYTPELWSEYVRDFITNVVKRPVVIAGNSIGGYISAFTSAKNPNLVKGLILINTAGRLVEDTKELPFQIDPVAEEPGKEETWADGLQKQVVAELGSRLIFAYLEKSVPDLLKKAYPQFPDRADEQLAREIERASTDPGAFDVFKSVFYLPPPVPLSTLLQEYDGPKMVFQGVNDPLNDARGRAEQMRRLVGEQELRVELVEAGHCPHDEVPELFNAAVDAFFDSSIAVKQPAASSSS